MESLSLQRWPEQEATELLKSTLTEKLTGKSYSSDTTPLLAREVADDLKHALKQKLPTHAQRHKLVVQVLLGEQRDAGVSLAARCLWDANVSHTHRHTAARLCPHRTARAAHARFAPNSHTLSCAPSTLSQTDGYAVATFREGSLFCSATAYGILLT